MMKQWLFSEKLTSKDSWLASRYAFSDNLVNYIAKKEHLQGHRERYSRSTNLIYGFDKLILKVFAPAVCGYQASEDFKREIYALRNLQNTELRIPTIVSEGCVHDQYDFYYLVLERLNIPPATQFLETCTPRELSRFGGELLESINILKEIPANKNLSKNEDLSVSPARLDIFSKYQPCFVHGDLSGDNILYDGSHLAIIDFEDWMYSTPVTEYPALVFELLQGKQTSIETFFSRPLTHTFLDEIFDGLICHYNWQHMVMKHCTNESHPPTSLEKARQMFKGNPWIF